MSKSVHTKAIRWLRNINSPESLEAAQIISALIARATAAEADLAKARGALSPFARVARIQPPGKESWPDTKPNSEFIPGSWPVWRDFRHAASTLSDLEIPS
jgi:hypothetical protein